MSEGNTPEKGTSENFSQAAAGATAPGFAERDAELLAAREEAGLYFDGN